MNTPPYKVMLARQKPLSEEELDSLPYPVFVQPKLDGIRAHYWNGDLWSRDNKKFSKNVIGHILEELKDANCQVSLDGELYVEGWSRQRINSAIGVKRLLPNEDSARVKFCIFDTIVFGETFAGRQDKNNFYNASTLTLQHAAFFNAEQVKHSYLRRLEQGYEGLIIRAANNLYTSGRSSTMWKMKPIQKMIVTVTGVLKGKKFTKYQEVCGALQCCFVDDTNTTINFNIGSGLTDKERHLWKNYPPNTIEIEYDSLSDDGIPLQPRIVRVVS